MPGECAVKEGGRCRQPAMIRRHFGKCMYREGIELGMCRQMELCCICCMDNLLEKEEIVENSSRRRK